MSKRGRITNGEINQTASVACVLHLTPFKELNKITVFDPEPMMLLDDMF